MELLRNGANVSAVDNDGKSALHYLAINRQHEKTLDLLLNQGAPASAKDNAGFSPLHYAMKKRSLPAIQKLLAAGADPLEPDPDGCSALHLIAHHLVGYDDSKVEALFKRFVKAGVDLNARDNKGNTPLFPYAAAQKVYSELETPLAPDYASQMLLWDGADFAARNAEGETLLHIVARRSAGEGERVNDERAQLNRDTVTVFKILLDKGLDARAEDHRQRTPLDIAAACGNEGILALFARNE